MFIATEGTVEIPLEQLWDWIIRYNPQLQKSLLCGGVPRFNKDNTTIEIDYAASSGDDPTDPREWYETPKALRQWQELDQK